MTAQEVVFAIDPPVEPALKTDLTAKARPDSKQPLTERSVLKMQFVGGAETLTAEGSEALTGVVNYLVGSDPKAWATGVPTFEPDRT